jgi:hypothetical protein
MFTTFRGKLSAVYSIKPAVIHMQAYHTSKDLIPLLTENNAQVCKPVHSDPTAIIAAKTLIIDKCAGIQSYAV